MKLGSSMVFVLKMALMVLSICLPRGETAIVDNSRGWATKAGNSEWSYGNVGNVDMKLGSSMSSYQISFDGIL